MASGAATGRPTRKSAPQLTARAQRGQKAKAKERARCAFVHNFRLQFYAWTVNYGPSVRVCAPVRTAKQASERVRELTLASTRQA